MALGAIELATIGRAQDYTTIKHNEDNKSMIDQTNLGQQQQRTEENRAKSVTDGQNADWHNNRQDAREKGKNEYAGDGGKNRNKNQTADRVVVKGRGSFDMKI